VVGEGVVDAPGDVRVAVVGTGSIGRRHLGTLLSLGCTDLVAVSEHGRRAELVVDGVDVAVRHRLDDVLGDVDLVVVASPTAHHRDQAAAAVAAGCHVLVEKPVGVSSAGLDQLAAAAEAGGLVAAAAHQFRFEPGLLALRDLMRSGALGVVLTVEAHQGEHLADYHPDEDYRTGYAARRDLGGGVLRTQIHHLDHLEWIFGPLVRVYAAGGHRTDLEIDVEDTATYLFRSADGTPVQGHLDYRQRPKVVSLVVVGTEGRAVWDHYGGRLVVTPVAPGAEPVVRSWPYDRAAMFTAQMRDVLEAVRTGRPPRTPLRDGIRAVRLVEAIELSMGADRAVSVATHDDGAGRADRGR
jgi:predicted dehydrogenase